MTERKSMLGFFDGDGKWATIQELEVEFGDKLDIPVQEALEELHEIGFVNVTRDEHGQIVTAQLSEFAADLYALPEDADIGRVVGVYKEHGREIPEKLKDQYWEEFQQNLRGEVTHE